VQVEPVRLVTGDLTQRYSTEASSGTAVADIVLMTDSPFFDQALESDWFTPLEELDIPTEGTALAEDYWENDGATPIVSLIPTDTVINTDEITEKPTAWTDYADPKFKGSLLLAEPDSSPANASFWSLMRQTYGDDFLRNVGANQPTWMNSAVPVTQGVAAGEGGVGHPGVAAVVNNLIGQGAPIELVKLTPTTGPEAAIGVSTNSPNQAGAKLLASYLMSEEGNTALNEETAAISPFSPDAEETFTRTKDIESVDAAEIRSLLGLK
jgi:iron(III) transport system substrate-binding protein